MKRVSAVIAVLLFCVVAASAQERPHAFVGAQIITVSGQPIPNGSLSFSEER